MEQFLIRRVAERLSETPCACPDADLLAASLEGQVCGEEQEAIDAHVAECPACAAVVADFARFALPVTACPALSDLVRGLLAGTEETVAHVAACQACAPVAAFVHDHPADAAHALELFEAENRARALGVAVSVAAVVSALLHRRATLSAQAHGRLHRSREGWLGRSAARPRRLVWAPFEKGEDTYEIALLTERGEVRLRSHAPRVEIDAEAWRRAGIEPGKAYRWQVTGLRSGRPMETQEGQVRFLSEEEAQAVASGEAMARELPVERAMLVLVNLYRDRGLYWDACSVLSALQRKYPDSPVGPLLLGEVCQEMDRVQEASRAIGAANRLLIPA